MFISSKVKVCLSFFYIKTYIYCNFVFTINESNRRLKNILITITCFVYNLDAQHCGLHVTVNNTSLLYACSGGNKRKAMVTS